MNFNKIITSVTLIAASLFASAQQLPKAHQENADEYINTTVNSQSFISQAFSAARANTELAAIAEPAANDGMIDMALANRLVANAQRHLGTRYVWGATGPGSFDCSGFTSYVYRQCGININRTSAAQYTQGQQVRQVRDMQPGDLLFFSSRRSGKGRVGHVGMVVSVDRENNTCRFIHASTKRGVTYQTFPDNAYYSRNYVGAKRIIAEHDNQMASND